LNITIITIKDEKLLPLRYSIISDDW